MVEKNYRKIFDLHAQNIYTLSIEGEIYYTCDY
jgi:hypothetical protein